MLLRPLRNLREGGGAGQGMEEESGSSFGMSRFGGLPLTGWKPMGSPSWRASKTGPKRQQYIRLGGQAVLLHLVCTLLRRTNGVSLGGPSPALSGEFQSG